MIKDYNLTYKSLFLLKLTFLFLVGIITYSPTLGQDYRYTKELFNNLDVINDLIYGSAPALNNPFFDQNDTYLEELKMDIYRPQGDANSQRPVIIFAHAGGFIRGDKGVDDMTEFCEQFAKRGYVTASINYRMGFSPVDNKGGTRAAYRGLQDMRSAIRFLRANATTYGIDPNHVYIVGSSAGAIIALHTVYMTQNYEIPSEAGAYSYPNPNNPSQTINAPDLGGYDIGNNLNQDGNPNAMISLWGAIQFPSLIENTDNTPVFLVHGTGDGVISFNIGQPFGAPNFPYVYGSNEINNRLNNLNFSNKETYFVLNKPHEFYGTGNGNWIGSSGNNYWNIILDKSINFLYQQHKPEASFQHIENNLTVEFEDTSIGAISWIWNFSDGNTSNNQDPTHTFTTDGNYDVTLYIENSIHSWDTVTHTITVTNSVTDSYTLGVNVSDGTNPISGAEISINNQQNTSDTSGATDTDLENGTYAYTVSANGFQSETGTITINNADEILNIVLTPIVNTYNLEVNISDGINPISGAEISINNQQFISNINGIANIKLENGTYLYTVSANGFQSETGTITINNADEILNIVLTPIVNTYNLEVNISDGINPILGAEISINNQQFISNINGIANIKLENGIYLYTISANGFQNQTGTITINNADEILNIVLTPIVNTYNLEVNISDGINPILGAEISINNQQFISNVNGITNINLENGTYLYTISANGFQSQTGTITINNADQKITIILMPDITILDPNTGDTLDSLTQVPVILVDVEDIIVCADDIPARLVGRDIANPDYFIYEWRNILDTTTLIQSDKMGVLGVRESGIFLVKVINPRTGQFKMDTAQVIIHELSDFEITGYQNPVCQEAVLLNITNINITDVSIQWTVQTNQNSANFFEGETSNSTVKVLKSGFYTATLTNNLTSCQTKKSIQVIINENPKLNFPIGIKNSTICENEVFVFDAFEANHPFEGIYEWKNISNSQIVSTSSKLEMQFENFEKTSYELTLIHPETFCQTKDTINVRFVKQSAAKIIVNKNDICLGEQISLKATGGDLYIWNAENTSETLTFVPKTAGIHTYILEAQNQNACYSTFDTVQIAVHALPQVNIETALGICEDNLTTFLDVQHSSHSLDAKYKWYRLGDTTTLSDSSRIELKKEHFMGANFDASQAFDLIISVSNAQNSCPVNDTISIEFEKKAIAKIDTQLPKEIFLGESITLQATGGQNSYWSTGDSTEVINVTPDKVGYHRFIFFTSNPNSCPMTSDTIYVKVKAIPVDTSGDNEDNEIDILNMQKKIHACQGEIVEIGKNNPEDLSYYWLPGGFTSPSIQVKVSGVYQLEVKQGEQMSKYTVEVEFMESPKLKSTKNTSFCFESEGNTNFSNEKTHKIGTQIRNFDAQSNYQYTWMDLNGSVLGNSDSLEINKEGVYVVEVFNRDFENVCSTFDTVRVDIRCSPRIFIPTAFSPNDDNLNERFTIYGSHIESFKMEIYDRWGSLIYVLERDNFEDIKKEEFWDGKVNHNSLPTGVYLWAIQYKKLTDNKSEIVNLNGKIDLIE